MAFWNITGGSQVTTFDADGNAVGTDIDQGSIRAMSTGTAFGANPKFTNVPLGEDNPVITIVSGIDQGGRGVIAANAAGNGQDVVQQALQQKEALQQEGQDNLEEERQGEGQEEGQEGPHQVNLQAQQDHGP